MSRLLSPLDGARALKAAAVEHYHVWFDPALPDHIALHAPAMTPALRERLAADGIEVRSVDATGLHEAVRRAFPEHFTLDDGQTLNDAFRENPPTVRTVALRVDAPGRPSRH